VFRTLAGSKSTFLAADDSINNWIFAAVPADRRWPSSFFRSILPVLSISTSKFHNMLFFQFVDTFTTLQSFSHRKSDENVVIVDGAMFVNRNYVTNDVTALHMGVFDYSAKHTL
jgi:hypothetical protein